MINTSAFITFLFLELRRILVIILLALASSGSFAQELYVNTEPASNMATGTVGFRFSSELKPLERRMGFRLAPEIMFGVSRHLMIHGTFYGSSFYQKKFHAEGGSLYAKYRFLALDQAQSHFRIAGYGRLSVIKNAEPYSEISLQGDNSGYQGGLVFTQLLHKLALSASTDYSYAVGNIKSPLSKGAGRNQVGYTFSAGYLLLPVSYQDYSQTNLNLYLEMLGKNSLDGKGHFLDIAPSLQFIFKSRTRLDLSFERQLTGNMSRLSKETYLLRLEYTIFNSFK